MTSFDEAQAIIARTAAQPATERVPFDRAANRVLAEPLHARTDAPRVAVAAMDGYAVRDEWTQPGIPLRVAGEALAGRRFTGELRSGEAVRIFTGAAVPRGADRVIMQEYAERDGDDVRFTPGYGPGRHIRTAGSDFAAGALLLPTGTRLHPRAMVAAAAADVAELTVHLQPTMAILATGDELTPPGTAHLSIDAIPESVSHGVAVMAEEAGAKIVHRASGMDDLPALEKAAAKALATAQLVVVTGGASVGDRDFARPMFAAHGLELLFAKVAIKPGKPVWLGRAGGRLVLGLPGNPTSAMVTARLFLIPLLAAMQGLSTPDPLRWRSLPLAAPLPATGDRETFVRACWTDEGLRPLSNQDSGAQAALTAADWLIRCPAGQQAVEADSTVSAIDF